MGEFDEDFNDDLFADEDDFLTSFEDEGDLPGASAPAPSSSAGSGLSSAERDQRQKAFENKVDQRLKVLRNRRAPVDKRKEAAYWLGESGEPKAISPLLQVYKTTQDSGLRKATEYALGMLKALGDALLEGDDREQQQAMALYEGIVFENKMGKRLGLPASTLMRIEGGLAVSFVLLLIIGMVLGGGGGEAQSVATPTDEVVATATPDASANRTVRSSLMDLYTSVEADVIAIEAAVTTVEEGGEPDCEPINALINAPQVTLSEALSTQFPQLVDVNRNLNIAIAALGTVRRPLEAFCQADSTPLPDNFTTSARAALNSVNSSMGTVSTLLDDPALDATLPPPSATPTPTITPTSTPTLDPNVISGHIRAITFIANNMIEQRGPNSLILQYWRDVLSGAPTNSCREPQPIIPENYILPEGELDELPQNLIDAADKVNLALSLTRDAWANFAAGCSAGDLLSRAENEIGRATSADELYREVVSSLLNLSNDE